MAKKMAKKTPVKKSRRRLKRSVRRSLAAVLMITAIGIAAIPVPENYAEEEDPSSPPTEETVTSGYTPVVGVLGEGETLDDKRQDPSKDPSSGGAIYSLDVFKDGDSLYLFWQFKIGKSNGKVYQYNNDFSYRLTSLEIDQRVPTNYIYVPTDDYDAFYKTKYPVTYDQVMGVEGAKISDEAIKFYETYGYFNNEYNEFRNKCNSGELNSNNSINFGVSDLTDGQQGVYYCLLKGIGTGTVKEGGNNYVFDKIQNRISTGDPAYEQLDADGQSDDFYLIRCTDNAPNRSTHDEDGYLYKDGMDITEIGPYAFAGNGFLRYIRLKDTLGEIGEGAFMDCVYLESVRIAGPIEIPAGAFKNCSSLQTVDWWSDEGTAQLQTIGREAFYGAGTRNIKFPIGLKSIGIAAFCSGLLESIEFDAPTETQYVDIAEYAFYDNYELKNVIFNSKNVSKLGDYCFAVGTGSPENQLTEFIFPNCDFTTGDKILANRMELKKITIPSRMTGELKSGILDGCYNLGCAEFLGGSATYVEDLFNSVTNREFYVTGPARNDDMHPTVDDISDARVAGPRKSTWNAEQTAAGQYIPYLYRIYSTPDGDGYVEYYEICSGDGYLESIDKNTNTLISCRLRPDKDVKDGELVIPDQVGGTPIYTIASGCFSDPRIISSVKTLAVGDNIMTIGNGVFKEWPNLTAVDIGKGIQTIGSEAFAGCLLLTDVTFATPDNYETLTLIDSDAFAVASEQLTIHGDIVKGYKPYEYAVDPNNFVGTSYTKYRILYQSRWDSPDSKHMSVMYGTYGGDNDDGYVALVDYPLYLDFYGAKGEVALSEDLQEHNKDMENMYYARYGSNFNTASNDDTSGLEFKVKFARDFAKWVLDEENDGKEYPYIEGKYSPDNGNYYGPWVNTNFCNNYTDWLAKTWLDKYGLDNVTEEQLEELNGKLRAGVKPTPYFTKYPYNFLKNYERHEGNMNLIVQDYWDGWTTDEAAMVRAAEVIIIPAGVDSIDLVAYYDNEQNPRNDIASNHENYRHYFALDRMGVFLSPDADARGLFSGYIDDKYSSGGSKPEEDGSKEDEEEGEEDDDEPGRMLARAIDDTSGIDKDDPITGKHRKGNDRIKIVDMRQSSITSIPAYAFDDCELLEQVYLPASCDTIGEMPFSGCTNLRTLESANDDFIVNNSILYEKQEDGYRLIECFLTRGVGGGETEWTVSAANDDPYISQVSTIDDGAFKDCQGIQYVDLTCIDNGDSPNKLEIIPESCFENCDKLLEVSLPNSVHTISDRAFAYIRELNYHGPIGPEPRLHISIKGSEVTIAPTAFDPKGTGDGAESTIDMVTLHSYMDSAPYRFYVQQHAKGYDIRFEEIGVNKRVNFWDHDGTILYSGLILDDTYSSPNRIFEDEIPAEVTAAVTDPNHWPGHTFREWLASGMIRIGDVIPGDSITYVAQYDSDGTMVNGKYTVEFIDGIDGHQLTDNYVANPDDGKYYVDAGKSFADMDRGGWRAPAYEEHEGYTFLEWSHNWTVNTIIDNNMTIVALYSADNSGGTTTSGGSTTTPSSSGSTTNTGSGGSTTTGSSRSTTSSSTSSGSTSTTSTTSGSGTSVGKYTVTVVNGSGSGTYDVGSTVIIAANTAPTGMVFQKWTTESNGVSFASVSMPATTFTMPANNVTVTANYVAGTAATAATGNGNTRPAGNSTTGNNGGTRVDITKPGISNKDLATANVNGSTDNFVVKISETDEATKAVTDALTNKYGSLENILYYAMDISLYDSTGTTKISDTTGLTVDITIPIPDALVAYGGNNMAGAVINGNQLENLNESFTTINGVPCIRFTATHFSPYTVFVDKGNLTEGMLDITPKTGDPIHPKWFLSIGLACLSIILFMKKDKRVKVKTA